MELKVGQVWTTTGKNPLRLKITFIEGNTLRGEWQDNKKTFNGSVSRLIKAFEANGYTLETELTTALS
jgi:hypothetical protein